MPEAVPFPVAYVLVSADSSPPAPSLTKPEVPTVGSLTVPVIVVVAEVLPIFTVVVPESPAVPYIVPILTVPSLTIVPPAAGRPPSIQTFPPLLVPVAAVALPALI